MKIDVHQHLWTAPLLRALRARRESPRAEREDGQTVLYLADERPYAIDLAGEDTERRAELVSRDGLDRALVCLSSPLGIESLPREEAVPLIDAYHEGALALGGPFGVWAALALDRPDPDDVDGALGRGCVGLSLPAGALAGADAIAALEPVLARLARLGAPLLVHPGPATPSGPGRPAGRVSPNDPAWWPALTGYVAGMHAAYLAFVAFGRARHPDLRVIFTMLAGLAPLHGERLAARGGPSSAGSDPLSFFETSSYGPEAIGALARVVGEERLLYGSDRPVLEPHALPQEHAWREIAEATRRALGTTAAVGGR